MRLRVLGTAVVLCGVLVSTGLAQECASNDPSLLKPDLVAQPPTKVRVLERSGHRWLIFTTTIVNMGDGPLIVHGQANGTATQEVRRTDGTSCTHAAGTLEFSALERNYHFTDAAAYQLRSGDPFTGPIAAESNPALCLMDNVQVRGFNVPRQVLANCADSNGTQGISTHFGDELDNFLPEQMIDLDADPANPVPGGSYFLVNIADPDGRLLEKDDATQANVGVASISIPGIAGQPVAHQPRPQPHTPPTPTPKGPNSVATHAAQPTRTPTYTPTATPLAATPTVRAPHAPHSSSHPSHPPHSLPPGHEGCGGISNKTCSAGEFCEFLAGSCAIQGLTGVCTPVNAVCSSVAQPVCGCNGVTYANDCQRRRASVSAAHSGPC